MGSGAPRTTKPVSSSVVVLAKLGDNPFLTVCTLARSMYVKSAPVAQQPTWDSQRELRQEKWGVDGMTMYVLNKHHIVLLAPCSQCTQSRFMWLWALSIFNRNLKPRNRLLNQFYFLTLLGTLATSLFAWFNLNLLHNSGWTSVSFQPNVRRLRWLRRLDGGFSVSMTWIELAWDCHRLTWPVAGDRPATRPPVIYGSGRAASRCARHRGRRYPADVAWEPRCAARQTDTAAQSNQPVGSLSTLRDRTEHRSLYCVTNWPSINYVAFFIFTLPSPCYTMVTLGLGAPLACYANAKRNARQ